MVSLQEVFTKTLAEAGFYDILLPWLLFFAIIFGLLQKTKLFGEAKEQRQLNLIIAAVIAFFVVNFVPGVTTLGALFTALFGQGALILAGILLAVLFISMVPGLPGEGLKPTGKWAKFVAAVLIIVSVIIFFASGVAAAVGLALGFPEVRVGQIGMDVILTIVMIAIILIAIIWLGREKEEKAPAVAVPGAGGG